MKEKFYVFTDIDGTLYDINYQHKVVIPRLESMFGKNVLASMNKMNLIESA